MELKLLSLRYHTMEHILLIVPYGIETKNLTDAANSIGLLIVPYGIETPVNTAKSAIIFSFNRTLWN